MSAKRPIGMPLYIVISAPDVAGLTPDDLVLEAWDKPHEVDAAWDVHDGRSYGSQVVGVYKLRIDEDTDDGITRYSYVRDESWGILGDVRKTRPADEEKDTM